MAAKGNVRTHTRRTASGKTTPVRRHSRGYRPGHGRALVSIGHAWRLARRAFGASRRRRRWIAFGLGVLALAEVAAWLTLQGALLVLTTAAVLAGVAALLAGMAVGLRA